MTLPEAWTSSQSILVILAHPDDPEFFCGATLAKWARARPHISYLLLTCGDKGFNPTTHPEMTPEKLCAIRPEEQYAAAKVIGAQSVHIMDHPGLPHPGLEPTPRSGARDPQTQTRHTRHL